MSQLNLIVLDTDPDACGRAYCDQDLMHRPRDYLDLLEMAQWQRNGGKVKSRHVLTKWAQDELSWAWVWLLVRGLAEEQLWRFGEQDEDIWPRLLALADEPYYNGHPPRFVQLLPEKIPGDPVAAYRQWYQGEAEPCWTRRGAPDWWKSSEQYALRF